MLLTEGDQQHLDHFARLLEGCPEPLMATSPVFAKVLHSKALILD